MVATKDNLWGTTEGTESTEKKTETRDPISSNTPEYILHLSVISVFSVVPRNLWLRLCRPRVLLLSSMPAVMSRRVWRNKVATFSISRRAGNGGARCARSTLHVYPPTSFQLYPANSWPGNRPPAAVYSPVYFCARLLFDISTDVRPALPDVASTRGGFCAGCHCWLVQQC